MKCKLCGTHFTPKVNRGQPRKFCNPLCGRKYHALKAKKKRKVKEKPVFPRWICQSCGYKEQLDYDPKTKAGGIIFLKHKCKKCS